MNILETIVAHKRKEVEERKDVTSITDLQKESFFKRDALSLRSFLLNEQKTGIIAEFKRKSPSKGVINDQVSVKEVTTAYARYGASGISVLTDGHFFGGSLDDLIDARINDVPLLRKDFTIDPYQIIEAKAYGGDVILLIAACLSPEEVRELAKTAKGIGLEVLLELHDESELGHICPEVDLVGVNNRNLKTFTVDLEHSILLAEKIGKEFVKVAESGISEIKNINYLKQYGFQGFLIGENFMKQSSPAEAFKNFVTDLKGVQV